MDVVARSVNPVAEVLGARTTNPLVNTTPLEVSSVRLGNKGNRAWPVGRAQPGVPAEWTGSSGDTGCPLFSRAVGLGLWAVLFEEQKAKGRQDHRRVVVEPAPTATLEVILGHPRRARSVMGFLTPRISSARVRSCAFFALNRISVLALCVGLIGPSKRVRTRAGFIPALRDYINLCTVSQRFQSEPSRRVKTARAPVGRDQGE
jgi:hypothetical protein